MSSKVSLPRSYDLSPSDCDIIASVITLLTISLKERSIFDFVLGDLESFSIRLLSISKRK